MGNPLGIVWDVVVEEFSDFGDLASLTRICLRLVIAALLGGVIGFERGRRGAAAGLRTHMLVGLGAALYIVVPSVAGMGMIGLDRVIQGVATGVGFLGAGAILKQDKRGQIQGLTTAAGIWLTAAVGMAVGMGRPVPGLIGTILAFIIVDNLRRVERRFGLGRQRSADRPTPVTRNSEDHPSP